MPITDYDGQLQTIARNLGKEPALTTTDGLLEAIAKGTENIITEDELDDYLPLTGGTMTGEITFNYVTPGGAYNAIKNSSGDKGVVIIGGDTDNFSGASLQLFGQTESTYAGEFYLRASTRNSVSDTSKPDSTLTGTPSGSLSWNSKEIERVNASGSNYIRFESGLQICFASVGNMSASTTITFPVPFIDVPFIVSGTNSSSANSSVTALTASGFTANMETYDHAYRYIAIGYWK